MDLFIPVRNVFWILMRLPLFLIDFSAGAPYNVALSLFGILKLYKTFNYGFYSLSRHYNYSAWI
jgi:hypothetical protein